MTNRQDYYKVGSRDNIVISSSSLKHIDPLDGGSPLRFLAFFDELIEEKESRSLRLGSLIHKWAEDKDSFSIGAVPKPSDKLGEVADVCFLIIEDLNKREEAVDLDKVVLEGCRVIGWNRDWKDNAIIKNACPKVKPYLEDFVKAENEGKTYMSLKDKEVVENCTESIRKNPLAWKLLFMSDTEFTDAVKVKEEGIYWEQKETLFKCMPDDVYINHELKAVFVTELKTMSNSVHQYKNFKYFRTYRQLAFQRKAITEYCFQNNINIDGYNWVYNVVGVETFGLFECVVWKIKEEWINRGTREILDLVKRIKWHIENDNWTQSREEYENGGYLEMPYEEDD